MTPPPFALEIPSTDAIGRLVLGALAVLGGAAVGGIVLGLITQGLSRMLTTRPVPRVPLLIVRLLGAIVCGWIVFLLVFGSGLGGFGGGGGWSLFGGGGPGGASGKEAPAETARSGGTGRDGGQTAPGGGRTLQVEVLPEYPAVYRVRTPGGPRTFKFDDLTGYLLEQKNARPPLTGIEVSGESSDPDAPAVRRLTEWARQNRLSAVTPPHPAP